MKRLVVASLNPVKARAVETGFRRLFPEEECVIESVSVPSGVRDQPWGESETRLGARNRAEAASGEVPAADYWIGLEGGVEEGPEGTLFAFAWVVVRGASGWGQSRTANFQLPPEVVELVRSGLELGEADDRVFGARGSKRKGGAIGLLTEGRIDRAGLYETAVSLAFVPFLNPGLYPGVKTSH